MGRPEADLKCGVCGGGGGAADLKCGVRVGGIPPPVQFQVRTPGIECNLVNATRPLRGNNKSCETLTEHVRIVCVCVCVLVLLVSATNNSLKPGLSLLVVAACSRVVLFVARSRL